MKPTAIAVDYTGHRVETAGSRVTSVTGSVAAVAWLVA
jgi:hypothetical protein